jgi:signal transduction histidine kinase
MKEKVLSFYKRYIRIIPGVRSYALVAVFVLIFGMLITTFAWYIDRERIDNQRQAELAQQASSVENSIRNQLNLYEQLLRGSSGLFKASDMVTREEWKLYIQEYDLERLYPGLTRITYSQLVKSSSLDSYFAAARSEGLPAFSINPPGNRPEYALLTYLEPYDDVAADLLGYDILADPTRQEAVYKARDTGKVTMSQRTVLASDRDTGQPAYTMYTPIYNRSTNPTTIEERRSNLVGYVSASYRANQFFAKAIDPAKLTTYSEVQVFEGSSTEQGNLLYQTADFSKVNQNEISQPYTISVLDHEWTYRFADSVDSTNNDDHRSALILVGGITISWAIAGFLFLVMLTRARAIVYAKQNEAQKAKDDLLSLASHQLRTPATAVKQYLGMILEGYTGTVDTKQLPALQKAYSSNERQLDTINQILYVAKADAGRLSIQRRYFDVNALIDEIALDLADMLEENEQSLIINHPHEKLKIYADEATIRMVIENLISNAAKYSYTDSKVTVKTGVREKQVFIAITDQGVGIDRDDFDKLFKKFSRIENDLSLQVGGSGIGLYIDKVLIELHGGRIEVESKVGHGSTFTILLPQPSANNLTDDDKNNSSV